VIKLWSGAASTNVRLVRSYQEAAGWIDRLFTRGVLNLAGGTFQYWKLSPGRLRAAAHLLFHGSPPGPQAWEVHRNYVLFQEFLEENSFDTRVTIIGNRAFAYRRFNRENDFRASGSGRIDNDPGQIDPAFVRLAFEVARKLRAQSCAMDGLWRGREPVVGEVSYTYVSRFVHDCPGHWDSELKWHEGKMWPEEAHVADFLARLEAWRQTECRR
jgi:hypothetical protein